MAWDFINQLKAIALPHASTHGSAGNDKVTPAAIGASATGHSHATADHAGTHGSAGSDPVSPAAIGAATSGHVHSQSVDPDALTIGEEVIPRQEVVSSTLVVTSQALRLTYFTCKKAQTTTKVRIVTGSTAAGATPTLCRIGLYLIDGAGAGTLVASIANDTALFNLANTGVVRNWLASYAMVVDQRYALGTLVVTTAATPTIAGIGLALAMDTENAQGPRLTGRLSTQTNLPASFTDASLVLTNNYQYGAVLP